MPRVTFNAQRKRKASTKKRRVSNVTKIRYGSTAARSQKRQIMSNALAIRKVKSMLPPPVWADWQYSGIMGSQVISGDDAFQLNIRSVPLANFRSWTNVLRQDPNVATAVATKLLRMSINLRYSLQGSSRAQMSLFIVTLRKNAASKDLNNLSLNEDFVRGPTDYQVRLNPSVFKVLYARDVSLTTNKWDSAPFFSGGDVLAGNPYTTFKKGQINIKLNSYVREPTGLQPWSEMQIFQLPYYQKVNMLCFFYQQGSGLEPGQGARVEWDMLATTYNSA